MGRLLVVTLRRWSALVTGRSSAFNGLNGLVVPWGRSKRLGLHRPGGLGGGRTGVGFAIDDPGLSNPTKGCPREGDRGFKQMPTCDLSKPRLSGIYIYLSSNFQHPSNMVHQKTLSPCHHFLGKVFEPIGKIKGRPQEASLRRMASTSTIAMLGHCRGQ